MEKIITGTSIVDRMHPRIWCWDYLALKPIKDNICDFSRIINEDDAKKILDLGCGTKPYEFFFPFVEKFVGFDIQPGERVDVVGVNWDLPFEDNEFDALISTQVFEHTAKIELSVLEIKRVVKSGGFIFVSVPFVYPEHGAPYDYYRFTQFGLMEIFKDFEILEIRPSTGYLSTLIRLGNIFLSYLPGSRYWLFWFFALSNLMALIFDKMFFLLSKLSPLFKRVYSNYMSMPENYTIIMRNR